MSKANLLIFGIVLAVSVALVYEYTTPNTPEIVENPEISQNEVREILLLEVIEHNVTLTDQELEMAYFGLLNKSEMSQADYDAFILERHGSREAFDAMVGDNLKVLKLINSQVNWSKISLEDEEIDAFIAANPSIFPAHQLEDPTFKEQFYNLAREQMFENQKQRLVNEYIGTVVEKYSAN